MRNIFDKCTWVLLLVSILGTIAISFIILLKAVYRFCVSILTDSLLYWLLYGIIASILSIIIVALLSNKEKTE